VFARPSAVRRAALVAALAQAAAARGDALDGAPGGARSLARAGATLVAVDDGTALAANPAALARRSAPRVSAGLAASRQTVHFDGAATFATGTPPPVESRAGAALLPWGGVALGLGERWVLAAALLPRAVHDVTYATPPSTFDPAADDRARFPQRYAGDRLLTERWEGGVGGAWRATPWLAVGAAALLTSTAVEHQRTVWGGPADAGPGVGDLGPEYDLRLSARGDGLAAGAALGVVVAGLELPVELALAARWRGATTLRGTPALADGRVIAPGTTPRVRAAPLGDAAARLSLPAEWCVRAGARLLLGRIGVEVDGELALGDAAPGWRLEGLGVDAGDGGAPVPVDGAPLGLELRGGLSLRAAVDVELVPGAVTLVAGAGWSRARVAAGGGPLAAGGDGLLLGGGIEGRVAGATVTLGIAQRLQPARGTDPSVTVIAPRGPGDVAAAVGEARAGLTAVALDVEVELP
jgi:hypothetical protein